MQLSIKPDVRVRGISNEILLAIMVAQSVFEAFQKDLTITSITDGDHKAGSLHHTGEAVDLRSRDIDGTVLMQILTQLRAQLGGSFDVVLEKDHIHVEYDPG